METTTGGPFFSGSHVALVNSKYNASLTDIAVLTEACQIFAAVCLLLLGAFLFTSLVSFFRSRTSLTANRGTTDDVAKPLAMPRHAGVTHLGVIMDGNRRYGRSHTSLGHAPATRGAPAAANANAPSHPQRDPLSALCESVVHGDAGSAEVLFVSEAVPGDAQPASTVTPSPQRESSAFRRFCDLIRGTPLDGHRCGGEKLLEFIRYAIDARIPMLSVYAFSTDNWHRPEREVNVLMTLFFFFFQRVRAAAREDGIFIRFVSTQPELLPARILSLMKSIECETRLLPTRRITVNVCVSYSGQTEVALASTRILYRRSLCGDFVSPVTTDELRHEMLRSVTQDEHELEDAYVFTADVPREPQLILRTSGEQRLSNFLSFESAYSEFFFLDKTWPEVTRDDLAAALNSFARRDVRLGR